MMTNPEPIFPPLSFNIRVWLCVALILATGYDVRAMSPGIQIADKMSATDTEQAEQMFAIGNDVLCQIRDVPIYERQIAPLIGRNVLLSLTELK